MTPFIILALPRSRTFWLSRFLSYDQWHCAHDEIIKARSLDDVKSWFAQPYTGTVETAASPFWRLIPHYAPNAKIVTIRRPVNDVLNSLGNIGFELNNEFIRSIKMYDRKLDQLENRLKNVIRIEFSDLENENTCGYLFEHLLELNHDQERWKKMNDMNLQISVLQQIRYVGAYQKQITKLAKTAKQFSISLMNPVSKIEDGMTIQEESLSTILTDGAKLFAEHSVDVGEPPDSYLSKNIPLMETLEQMGRLQIHTARSNGRLFGYLISIISPSMERQNTLSGIHTIFFTSKDVKNLGMKLQRASVEALKAKGCDEVIFRAGIRGSTAGRISTLYRRMGAEPFGELYRLGLE